MRLEKIQNYLSEKGWEFHYTEEDGLGSIDFDHRGVAYHIWEFLDGEYGVESNVKNAGRQEEYCGDYQQEILDILESWKLKP